MKIHRPIASPPRQVQDRVDSIVSIDHPRYGFVRELALLIDATYRADALEAFDDAAVNFHDFGLSPTGPIGALFAELRAIAREKETQ